MKKNNQNQKGVSLLLTLLIMAVILVIALGVSRLSIGEIKLSRDIAYFAAESGIERVLYDDRVGSGATRILSPVCIDDENEICYTIEEVAGVSPGRILSSNGSYKAVRRAIRVGF